MSHHFQHDISMEIKAFFSDIHKIILSHLNAAQSEIVVAVAWFTDKEIFNILCRKAQLGVKVSIITIDDDINFRQGGLNFQRLIDAGGSAVFLQRESRNSQTMHHKFCVIDSSTVISGSYNWSQNARSNDENITVASQAYELARDYLNAFEQILIRSGNFTPQSRPRPQPLPPPKPQPQALPQTPPPPMQPRLQPPPQPLPPTPPARPPIPLSANGAPPTQPIGKTAPPKTDRARDKIFLKYLSTAAIAIVIIVIINIYRQTPVNLDRTWNEVNKQQNTQSNYNNHNYPNY